MDPWHAAMKLGDAAQALALGLRWTRTQKGLSQEQVAFSAGIAVQTYSCLERGRSPAGGDANPTLDTILRILAALDLDVPMLSNGPVHPDGAPDLGPTGGSRTG